MWLYVGKKVCYNLKYMTVILTNGMKFRGTEVLDKLV